jgi:hypothetical protein
VQANDLLVVHSLSEFLSQYPTVLFFHHKDDVRPTELKGADLILTLSSMLHSIGVGNMTPAGVRLICVDINPAVVTKLSDRGSIESVGVVTDVGLFLNLLTQRLGKLDQVDSA